MKKNNDIRVFNTVFDNIGQSSSFAAIQNFGRDNGIMFFFNPSNTSFGGVRPTIRNIVGDAFNFIGDARYPRNVNPFFGDYELDLINIGGDAFKLQEGGEFGSLALGNINATGISGYMFNLVGRGNKLVFVGTELEGIATLGDIHFADDDIRTFSEIQSLGPFEDIYNNYVEVQ